MSEIYSIQFTRNKEEAKQAYYNKEFKKSIRMQIIRTILFLPGFAMAAFFFTIALQVAFETINSDFITWLLTIVFTLVFLAPFIKPIIKVYQLTNHHIHQLYKSREVVTTQCDFDGTGFKYRNDFFEFNTAWENVRNLKHDDRYVQFQSKMPNVLFILPKNSLAPEVLNFIRTNIDKATTTGS